MGSASGAACACTSCTANNAMIKAMKRTLLSQKSTIGIDGKSMVVHTLCMRDFNLLVVATAFLAAPPCPAAAQRSIAELRPLATIQLGKTADWVAVTADAVWVASTGPFAVNRINPKTNTLVARIELPGEACAGLALGAGSLWVPLCTAKASLAKIDLRSNTLASVYPVGPPAEEGGIAYGAGSVWLVIDKLGTLARISPANGAVVGTFHVPAGSYNPAFLDGAVWVTHADGSDVTGVDAVSGKIIAAVATGPNPRFLTAGAGAIWTLNQGDGTLTRVDLRSRRALTIPLGTPGHGGDIAYSSGAIWTSMPRVPLSLIDAGQNRLQCQWAGPGGDALNIGHGSLWLTDYHAGTIERLALKDVLAHCSNS
jgi:virginiamycin B lyase